MNSEKNLEAKHCVCHFSKKEKNIILLSHFEGRRISFSNDRANWKAIKSSNHALKHHFLSPSAVRDTFCDVLRRRYKKIYFLFPLRDLIKMPKRAKKKATHRTNKNHIFLLLLFSLLKSLKA